MAVSSQHTTSRRFMPLSTMTEASELTRVRMPFMRAMSRTLRASMRSCEIWPHLMEGPPISRLSGCSVVLAVPAGAPVGAKQRGRNGEAGVCRASLVGRWVTCTCSGALHVKLRRACGLFTLLGREGQTGARTAQRVDQRPRSTVARRAGESVARWPPCGVVM